MRVQRRRQQIDASPPLLLHSSLMPSFCCVFARPRARPPNCSLVEIWSVCALCTGCLASTNMRPSSNSIRPPICSPPPRTHEDFVIYLSNLHVGIQLRQPCLHVCACGPEFSAHQIYILRAYVRSNQPAVPYSRSQKKSLGFCQRNTKNRKLSFVKYPCKCSA